MTYNRYESALKLVARVVFVAGLLVLLIGVNTDAVTIQRSPLGFFLWLVFGGVLLSGIVIAFSSAASSVTKSN